MNDLCFRNPSGPPGPIPEDRELPQLRLLLRPEKMSRLLGPGDWRIRYLRYKPGTNCIVLYRRIDAEIAHWTYCKAFHRGRQPRSSDRWRLNEYHSDLNLALVRFPRDLQLPALCRAFRTADQESLLERWVYRERRRDYRRQWGLWNCVRYKPERRCLLQGSSETAKGTPTDYYLRVYRRGHVGALLKRHRFLLSLSGGVRIPRLAGASRKHRVLITEGVPGRPLTELLATTSSVARDVLRATAWALSRWHSQEIPSGLTARPIDTWRIVRQERMLSRLLPSDARVGATVNRLARAAGAVSVRGECLLHGDFYHDQVLVDDEMTVSFVDLDELSTGDPETDVANFCAHLRVGGLLGRFDRRAVADWEREFLDEYRLRSPGRLEPRRLNWRLAESLLSLAVQPFRSFRFDWPERVEDIVREAWEATRCLR